MLVLLRARVEGDPQEMARRYAEDPELQAARQKAGQPDGCLRHRVFAADGELIVVDEYETAEQFQAWLSNPQMQQILGSLGIAQPDVTFAEQLVMGDEVG